MGARLRHLRRRRLSVESTMKITRAMELIAASRIVKAQQRLREAVPYARRIEQVIQGLAGITEVEHEFPLLKARPEIRTEGLLVITSDRGLAGAYNSNVIREAEQAFREAQGRGRRVRLYVAGKKGLSYFRFRRYEIAAEWQGVSDTPRYDDAEAIGQVLMDDFIDETIDRLQIAYTDYRSAVAQVATTTQVLPISREEIEAEEGAEVPPLYEFEPEPAEILTLLLPRYAKTVVYAAMLESSASEHAARRRAMKAATENARDLIADLNRVLNRERQAEITTEIMDVVGGAEALRQAEKATV